jgi:prepilin-type N-terminal cleavage/methylation domain-containing protein
MAKNSGSKGFSLLEVLIVIFVLAVVVITLINIFIYGFNLTRKTEEVALATHVAQLEVERYRDMAFDLVSAQNPSTTTKLLTLADYPFLFRADGSPYLKNGQMMTALGSGAVGAIGEQDIIKLTVVITWNFKNQATRKDIVTYITRNGIYR